MSIGDMSNDSIREWNAAASGSDWREFGSSPLTTWGGVPKNPVYDVRLKAPAR